MTSATHEHCWEHIPWLVNGRLGETEQQRVLAHTESCAECRAELQQQRELHAHLQGMPDEQRVPEESWSKLLARIDAEPQTTGASVSTAASPRGARRWWSAAVWAQGVTIVLLASLLAWRQPAEYVTLSTPEPTQLRGSIRVVFAPSAPLTRVNDLLHAIDGEIVAGPSEAGVYTVAVTAANPASAIATLRQHKEVLFAESTAAAGAPRR